MPKKTTTQVEKVDANAERIASSRKSLEGTLTDTQQFFEAPDGFVMVGEKTQDRVWYRQGNNGEGMWINPRR